MGKPSAEDWKRAHQEGVASLKSGLVAAGVPEDEAYRKASAIQERATNQARAEHEAT